MKRNLLTRFGEIDNIEIPSVVKAGSIPIRESYSERNKFINISGKILTVNRINRFNTREFVRTIIQLRKNYLDKIIYLPNAGLIYDYPILFYLGIDVLDDLPIRILGDDKCITEFGILEGENCLEKNMKEKERMVERIKLSLENSKFRELVEGYSMTSFGVEALRISDMLFYGDIEPFLDFRERDVRANNIESIYRPEIEYFRRRVKNLRQTSQNLLLIPCSAIKPYSQSKTHKILHSRIYPFLSGIQEVIVTSPLGLVPRELENFFPVKNYDIPVTGYWFKDEKEMLHNLAIEFFQNKKYDNVFFILSKEESEFLDIFPNAEGIIGNLNFENSEKIQKIISSRDIKKDRNQKRKIEFSNILRYLYDIDIEPSDLKIEDEGNRSFVKTGKEILLKKTVAGVSMEKGLGELLYRSGKRFIEVSGKFQGDSVYIPGIVSISSDVRPGNEIVLVYNGEIIGKGISQLSILDLQIQKKGLGISQVSYFPKEK
ncbi:MAG: DUF5591 domain-containing protein [Thermoplasmata archaeon]